MLILKSIRCIIADILCFLCSADQKKCIRADASRNLKWDANRDKIKGDLFRINYLLLTKTEFRSIFYYRVRRHRHMIALCKIFLPPVDTVEFGDGDMGGGILVSHYHSVICPRKTGTNFRVGPGVVIDAAEDGTAPTFGDNVYVASNSTVIGDIHIGDNVIIGAGSVVEEDLPSDGVYVGNPARLIKHIGDHAGLLNEIM